MGKVKLFFLLCSMYLISVLLICTIISYLDIALVRYFHV